MKRILIPVLAFVAAMSVSSLSYATTLLGNAELYNVFVFGDMNVGSDTQGRVAVGGNFSTTTGYSIGLLSPATQYSLVSGGNVAFGPGTIFHGGIYSDGNVALHNFSVQGDVVAKGTVTDTNPISGTINGTIRANSSLSGPVDFTAAEIYLKGVSHDLSLATINGNTAYSYSNITLSGHDAVNVFNVSGAALNNATSLTFNFASDEIGIVNVSGTSCDFGPMGMTGGVAGNILFNFYEATSLNIHNIGVTGSILAPYADIAFNSGVVHGSVIAESIVGGGQFNQSLFDHEIPGGSQPVPEPATMLLFGSGLAGLSATRLRKRKSGN